MFRSAGFGALGWIRLAAATACPAELLAQSATLVPPSAIALGWFGHGVGLDSGRLAVGAPFSEDPSGRHTGRAYVYERAGGAVVVGAESEGPGSIL